MLMPKRTKYRRPHRVKYEGKAKGGKTVAFGDFGLVALDGAWITSRLKSLWKYVWVQVKVLQNSG